jgi:hypothetical protein
MTSPSIEYTSYLKTVIQKSLEESLNNTNILKPYWKVFLEKKCAVCWSPFDFEGNSDVVVLPCGHMMHENCIKEWSEKQKVSKFDCPCPKCKKTFLAQRGN